MNSNKYMLTEADILKLYCFSSPKEIQNTFSSERCPSESQIYKIIKKHELEKPSRAKEMLRELILEFLPVDDDSVDWDGTCQPHLSQLFKN